MNKRNLKPYKFYETGGLAHEKTVLKKICFADAHHKFTGFSPACGKDKEAQEEAALYAVSASVSGTLTRFTGSELSLETDTGEKLTFDNCSDASLELENGIIPGNNITIVYTGSVKDGGSGNAKVRKIISTEDNSGVLNLAEKAEEGLTNVNGSAVNSQGDRTGYS